MQSLQIDYDIMIMEFFNSKCVLNDICNNVIICIGMMSFSEEGKSSKFTYGDNQ
jgi:hypothetical protein